MLFHVFLFNIIKVNHFLFLYCFIILLYLIFSFSLNRSLLNPYAYDFIESIHCILLSSFELKEILLFSSAKTLCLTLLNLWCAFNTSLFLFMNSIWSFLRLSNLISFFLDNLYFYQVQLLLNKFYNLKFNFSFYDTHFFVFRFFIFST